MTTLNEIATRGPALPVVSEFKTKVNPQALQELFNRDPENLSDADLDVIIVELRNQRVNFEQNEEAKALKPKRVSAKAVSKEEAAQLTLDDLGL